MKKFKEFMLFLLYKEFLLFEYNETDKFLVKVKRNLMKIYKESHFLMIEINLYGNILKHCIHIF